MRSAIPILEQSVPRGHRRRINSLNTAPIREILERWIGKYEACWSNTLLRVKESAETGKASAPEKKAKGKRA
jgi:hypothetical protein